MATGSPTTNAAEGEEGYKGEPDLNIATTTQSSLDGSLIMDMIAEPAEDVEARAVEEVGTKISPICRDPGMVEEAMTPDQLEKFCFQESFSLFEAQFNSAPGVASLSSQSTSLLSNKSLHSWASPEDGDIDTVLTQLMKNSARINSQVEIRTVSRHGRSGQRWIVDEESKEVTRMVTGCVPIMASGRIMMVSASKKNEWILPKGGWEMDESLEESAIRETFEEAGVLGLLGPKLSEVQYETRKARKRRLALEEKLKSKADADKQFSSGWSDVSQLTEDDHLVAEKHESSKGGLPPASRIQPPPIGEILAQEDSPASALVSPEKPFKTESASIEQSPLTYNHVRVSLFPLYVKEVKSTWPECGRLRKAADIDHAIQLLADRPEMQSALMEVKVKGFHLV